MSALKLSVLDQSPVASGRSQSDAVNETLRLAELTDRLGFTRYWLAEHHSSEGLAGSAPEILIGAVAARTQRIRVGSGGVMLNHYSPYKIAEQFRMLEALYPGRIDLGIGRAPGSDQITAAALAYGPFKPIDQFPRQIKDLVDFLHDDIAADHPFARVHATPLATESERSPEMWLLGSSDQSAMMAAYFGLPFCFAHFITGEGGPFVMDAYRRNYAPSGSFPEATGTIGVHVICAESDQAADRLAQSRDLWRLNAERGRHLPIPSLAEVDEHAFSDHEQARIGGYRQRQIIGSPGTVRAGIEALARDYAVDEVVILTITHDFAARCRSYELVAEAFELSGTSAAA